VKVSERRFREVADAASDIQRLIDEAREIGCLAHKDADADSLGSALAFAEALREMGKSVHTVVPRPLPHALAYLPGYDTIIESVAHVINVDHHASNDGFGEINVVDTVASATGQVVYRLLQAMGCPISPETATNLYAALLTDTGGFRHENTTEAALRLGADLVGLGANAGWIALKSYKSRTVAQLRLEGMAVARSKTESDGRLIWSEITSAMLEETGTTLQEAEGVIDQLQTVGPMKIAVLFKQAGPHLTKISVRSRDEIDATQVCTPFGGGGHRRAAGAELREPLGTARKRVLDVARALLGPSS